MPGAPARASYQRSQRLLAAACLGLSLPLPLIALFRDRLFFAFDPQTYLVFHNVAEFFAVATSFAIFAVAWFTHEQAQDRHALVLGCIFLAVGLMDLMHTLGYAGMPALFTPNSAGKSTQFWIATRLSSALAFLGSAFVGRANRSRWLARPILLSASLGLAGAVFTLVVFFPEQLPATYVPGAGLTPFKRGAEVVIVALLALASGAYWRRASRAADPLLAMYAAALAICAISEIPFAIYQSVFDAHNVIGHLYKVAAFGLVFRGSFIASVQRPRLELLAKEEALRQEMAEHQAAEAERRRTEGKFLAFAEAADQVFWITRRAPEAVVYVNPAFESVWGVPVLELYRDARAWTRAIHPEDLPAVQTAYARWLAGPADAPYDVQYRIVRPDGGVRWIADRGFVLERQDGEVRQVAGIARDVTQRRKVEDQLRQSQKLEAVGRLAGGVAHDFNNLLTVIAGGCAVLKETLPAQGEPRQEVEEIEAAANRAAALTRQLLSFSRLHVAEPMVLELNEVVEGMDRMLRRLIGEDVELVTVFGAAPGRIRADPSQVEQVIVNLVVNARDAMPGGGRLTIETSDTVVDRDDGGPPPGGAAAPRRYVSLAISDSGSGMTPEVQAHLFEPFYTTKGVGKGTGLGLSTVYGIVQQAGGRIRVQSAPGEGSRFEVLLPRVEESVASAGEQEAAAAAGGTETVLLVEDDALIRRLGARALRGAGYTVLEAANGEEALRVAARAPALALLVSDVVMPILGGVQVAERLRQDRPGLPVLFVSGYNEQQLAEEGADGLTVVQAKPFTPRVLLRRVRELLDRRSRTAQASHGAAPPAPGAPPPAVLATTGPTPGKPGSGR